MHNRCTRLNTHVHTCARKEAAKRSAKLTMTSAYAVRGCVERSTTGDLVKRCSTSVESCTCAGIATKWQPGSVSAAPQCFVPIVGTHADTDACTHTHTCTHMHTHAHIHTSGALRVRAQP